MSFFKRHQHAYPEDHEDDDSAIDPELRLRTVRTAASAIAESIQSERRAERRKTLRQKRSRFFFKSDKQKISSSEPPPPQSKAPGARRNIYVNYPLSAREVDSKGEPLVRYVRNKVRTSSTSADLLLCSTLILPQSIRSSHLYPKTCMNNSDGMSE
jgi:phospholipid-translocating ATPase